MQRFGTLSFGHYGPLGGGRQLTAADSMLQAIDLAQGMDDLGVDGTYFRVHHFARQQSSPMPLLAAIAARTERIEVGTGVIDMRYENPLYLAEEAASVDLISGGRLALGVSRGSPETVVRGYEAFGYTGSQDPRGADIAREHFELFLRAIEGEGLAERDAASPLRRRGGDAADRAALPRPALAHLVGRRQSRLRRVGGPHGRQPHVVDAAHLGGRPALRHPAGRADRRLPRRLARRGSCRASRASR